MNRILTLVFVAFAFVLSGCAEPLLKRPLNKMVCQREAISKR